MKFNYKKLKTIMAEKGITKADLSRLTGMPKNSIGHYVNGTVKQPNPHKLSQLAKAIGVLEDELYENDGSSEIAVTSEKITLTVKEAAQLMGCGEELVRAGMRSNSFIPSIGSAVKGQGEHYRYHIPLKRVQAYMLLEESAG